MKMISGKCHLFVSGNKHEHMWAKIGDDQIWESKTVKLLGITMDNELKLDEYISNVCKNTQRKLIVLTRIKKYLDFNCDFYLKYFLILCLNIVLSPGCSIVEL